MNKHRQREQRWTSPTRKQRSPSRTIRRSSVLVVMAAILFAGVQVHSLTKWKNHRAQEQVWHPSTDPYPQRLRTEAPMGQVRNDRTASTTSSTDFTSTTASIEPSAALYERNSTTTTTPTAHLSSDEQKRKKQKKKTTSTSTVQSTSMAELLPNATVDSDNQQTKEEKKKSKQNKPEDGKEQKQEQEISSQISAVDTSAIRKRPGSRHHFRPVVADVGF